MSTEKRNVIGTAELEYDEAGKLEAATFYPKIKVAFDDIKDQLGNCTNKTIDEVKQSAELLLGAYFTKVNNIELRDIITQPIALEVTKETFYLNGAIHKVEIQFICTL
jgi:hypothetical protein